MAITYTDIRNRQAQAQALDAVNNYLIERQDARKPIEEEDKKTVEGAKSLAAFYNKEDEYATQLKNIVNLSPAEQNVVLENIYTNVSKPKKTTTPPKTIEGVRNLATAYGLDYSEQIKMIESLPEGSAERTAAVNDAFSDITKDQKDKPVQFNIDNLQAGVDEMPEGKKKKTANRMLVQMRKVGPGAKMYNLYGNKIMNNIAADAEVPKEKPMTKGNLAKIEKEEMIKTFREVYPDFDNAMVMEPTDLKEPRLLTSYKNFKKAQATDMARSNKREYKGQMVYAPEEINLTMRLANTPIYKEYQKFAIGDSNAKNDELLFSKGDIDNDEYMRREKIRFFNFVKNIQNERVTSADQYMDFYILDYPSIEDFQERFNPAQLFQQMNNE